MLRAVVPLGGVLISLISCAPAEPALSNPRATRVSSVPLPGPAPRGRDPNEAAALNGKCEACHVEIALEWRGSLHARSHTDEVYQRAFAIEPLPFCQGCHAPEADASREVPISVGEIGVACVTCHVLGGEVVAARHGDDRPQAAQQRAPAPHPVLRDARLATTAACAGCHEFAFPDSGARSTPELMQATVSEHARSKHRDRSCADCHMPETRHGSVSHRSHAFAGGRDAALVQSAVKVTAERSREGARISITPRELGHAFPTGDLFRRLEVSAEAIGGEWQVVTAKRRYLARHFQRQPSPFGVVLRAATTDDRPLAAVVEVDLQLGFAAAGLPIAWRVAYQRVEHPRSEREQDSQVEGEIEIEIGTLESRP